MKRLELNGVWKFRGIDRYRSASAHNRNALEWLEGTVPGTVHTDLMANGIIPDPFYRMNELDVQWVEKFQWLYRKEFILPEEMLREQKIVLVAKGLDTLCRISLNGRIVGQTANMFVEHCFDVKRFLRAGENVIEILFDSPVHGAKALERKHGQLQVALQPHRVYVRKAQYSFGWDWGPALTTSGIWRDIYLEAYSTGKVSDPWIRVDSATKRHAVISIEATVESAGLKKLNLRVVIESGDLPIAETTIPVIRGKGRTSVVIPNPRLWWPHGYGEQALYRAKFLLVESNSLAEVHSVSTSFGIRTVRLLQERDDEGKTFIVEINGVKVFCKGANWIPADSFLPRIQASVYEDLLRRAVEANMNMLRVWGGGIYEHDYFYELCDRLGLMVWQDFMFACGEYPEHQWFLSLVETEAAHVVRRLRNHPSIVLWCGNNECEWIYCTENPGKTPDDMVGSSIFREILPRAVRKHDGSRPYWRSSPWGQGFPNDETSGNHHQWTVWSSWKDYREYEKDHGRFVTEFGFQAPAHLKTYEAITLPEDRLPQSPVMEHHNKQVEGTERLFRFQSGHVTVGATFEDFLYKGQIVQAEALKCAVEHWRRRKFKTAGSLIWQLNDCWPVTSWSLIDSSLRPKAAWYYAQRFFAPILVSIKKDARRIEVWGTNDTLQAFDGTLAAALLSFTGAVLFQTEKKVTLPGNSSRLLLSVRNRSLPPCDPASHYFRVGLIRNSQPVSVNRLFFVEPKHFRLPVPRITTSVTADEQFILVQVSSDVFAKNVWLDVADALFDDNFFDLDAGETKIVRTRSTGTAGELEERLIIRWLQSCQSELTREIIRKQLR